MDSRTIIKKAIEFDHPERIGWDFYRDGLSDFCYTGVPFPVEAWRHDEALRKQVGGFAGELRRDPFGSIWGRLNGVTKGECLKGVIEEDWDLAKDYVFPVIDYSWKTDIARQIGDRKDKYTIGSLPGMPFSIMRTMRGLDNFLADTVLEQENLIDFGGRIMDFVCSYIDFYFECGIDSVMFWEDWGMQHTLFINPECFRKIFKPWLKRLCDKAESKGMPVIMHSCGYIYDIIPDIIEAGVKVLQLDQPENVGVDVLHRDFAGKIAFFCNVDIQKDMQSGDRATIENAARAIIQKLGTPSGGLIAKDYGAWSEINVQEEWAEWARQVFMQEGWLKR